MALTDRINGDLAAATKARDILRMNTLRMAKAALKNREIDKRGPLEEGEEVRVLQQLVKQREDSASQYTAAGRGELAEKETAEIAVLKQYLPQDVGEDEIRAAVEAAVAETGASSARDMGKVMKAALAALQAGGKAVDGKRVNEAVRARLGA
ncbi:MAG TPA: GatB/YqeY domain-containing protein [Vicinamibacteria bacterium]|nr:GatB/YqeY domain-containing protein [Vicinamibacteria bacterium]